MRVTSNLKKREWTVDLAAFQGPLDLLLHLIQKQKIDIYDIPIVSITDQYLDYLKTIPEERLEVMSEFLVMASQLIAIKIRMLLPKHDEVEEDPREDLVRQLVQYRYFQEVAEQMQQLVKRGEVLWMREQNLPDDVKSFSYKPNVEELFAEVSAEDLALLYQEAIQEMRLRIDPQRSGFGRIEEDRWTVTDCMTSIRNRLTSGAKTFSQLCQDVTSRLHFAMLFLAMLELMKMGEIGISQSQPLGPIEIFERRRTQE